MSAAPFRLAYFGRQPERTDKQKKNLAILICVQNRTPFELGPDCRR